MRKIIALFSAAAVLASSAAASAHERYRHGYDRDHGYPAYGYGHHYRAYPQLRYPGYQPYYGQGYNYPPYGYAPGYYYQPGAYGYYAPDDYNRTCDDAAAGAILGGVAGAVIGREIAKDGHHKRYHTWNHRHGGDKLAGTLVGGALGAVVGGAIASSNC